jgi:signal transduction histidine kinase
MKRNELNYKPSMDFSSSHEMGKMKELLAISKEFGAAVSQADSCVGPINTFLSRLRESLEGVAIALWEADATGDVLQAVASSGLPAAYLEHGNEQARNHPLRKLAPTYQVFEAQQPGKITGLLDDPGAPFYEFASRLGYDTLCIAPVTCGGARIGVLALYQPRMTSFNKQAALDWLDFVSGQFAIAYRQKQLHLKAQAALQHYKRQGRYKDEFLSAVSHELRTPLTVIKGYAELIADGSFGGLPAPMAETIGKMELALSQMEYVVNDLVDVAAAKAGKLPVKTQVADYSQVLEDVSLMAEVLCQQKGLRLVKDYPSDLVGMIDPNRMKQVLINLIGNAVKFTPQGAVSIKAARHGDRILTEVSDTGIGVPHEDLPFIFEAFFRVDNSRVRETSGIGLGLSLAAFIVKEHGGELGVNSAPGQGSTFRFDLPAAP